MARNRLPQRKAEVSGAALKNPGRYADRATHELPELGEPYPNMTEGQKEAWQELRENLPWLNRGHRQIVRAACKLIALMDEPEGIGVAATHALSAILSKLGATPVDESRVSGNFRDEEDPNDQFFGKPH